jgi:hypothetical protein
MWIPTTAAEIEDSARSGRLVETPSFDAKADLPTAKKNIDLATDVAAMATDGGALLYGVGEDEDRNPTMPAPITLTGAPERVSEIVSTSIAEVPFIDVRTFPLSDDPSRGFLVVVVPQSARAPHMVIVKGDNRFYGRAAKGNRPLNEGDVARLYERRQGWEIDRFQVLDEAIAHAPLPVLREQGYLHVFARPVALEQGLFARAVKQLGGASEMHVRILQTIHRAKLTGTYSPSLEQAQYWQRHGADQWRLSTRNEADHSVEEATSLVDLNIYLDGYGRLFCGRATDLMREKGTPLIIESLIAGNVEVFFTVMAMLYDAAGYHGAVDVGLAITGISGARSMQLEQRGFRPGPTYPADKYSRTERVAAMQLLDAPEIARQLLQDFFDASTGADGWSPWPEPEDQSNTVAS